GDTSGALAYAPVAITTAPITTGTVPARAAAVAAPAAARSAPLTPTAPAPAAMSIEPDTTIAVKRSGGRPTLISSPTGAGLAAQVKAGDVFSNPWMRAMMLAPSAERFMITALLGALDFRDFGAFMQKPQASVMMTFSADPHLGMTSDRFRGSAVVFVST